MIPIYVIKAHNEYPFKLSIFGVPVMGILFNVSRDFIGDLKQNVFKITLNFTYALVKAFNYSSATAE